MRKYKLLILALVVLLVTGPVFATDYYVKNGGNDAASGLDDDNAWETIAKVNGESFSGDDIIYFNKDDEWREQLTVPDSGTSGHQITFGAYGTGADPIINGSDLVATWTAFQSWQTAYDPTLGSTGTGTIDRNVRNVIDASHSSYDGTQVRITLKTSASVLFNGTSIGVMTTDDDFDSAPTRITWDTGSNSTTVNGTKVSDTVSFSFDKDVRHGIHVCMEQITSVYLTYSGAHDAYLLSSEDTDDTMTQSISGYTTLAGDCYAVDLVEVLSGVANVWQATLTTEPNQIFFDGTRGTVQASAAACTSEFDWFWDSNVLYVYAASDPDALYADPGIEASVRDRCIFIDSKNYNTIQDIDFKYANLDNIGIDGGSDNVIINSVNTDYAYWRGIQISTAAGTCSNNTVSNSTVTYNGGNGIWVGGNTATTLIDSNTVHHNCQLAIDGSQHIYTGGIKANTSTCVGLIIENNAVYSEGAGNTGARGCGIWTDTQVPAPIIRYNKSYDNARKGIYIEETSDAQVYYNLVWDNTQTGIHLRGDAQVCTDNKIYNNVSYSNTGGGIAVQGDGATSDCISDNLIRNNITVGNTHVGTGKYEFSCFDGGENDGTYGSGNIYEYNCFDAETTGFIGWAGVAKDTYDEFETSYGGSTYSVESDPLMTDPANDDFTLNPHSPCVDAGTDVSLTEDYLGLKIRHAPDIGAYENQTNALFHSVIVTLRIIENIGRLLWP